MSVIIHSAFIHEIMITLFSHFLTDIMRVWFSSQVYLFATRAGTDKQDSSNRSDVSHDKVAYKEKGVSEDRNAMKRFVFYH